MELRTSLLLLLAPAAPHAALRAGVPSLCARGSDEVARTLADVSARVDATHALMNLADRAQRADELEARSTEDGFWDDTSAAEAVLKQMSEHRAVMERAARWRRELADADAAVSLGLEEDSAELLDEARNALDALSAELREWETRALMSGAYDAMGAVLTITSGAGGVDAQDWAAMLLRMYERWAEKAGRRARMCERSDGEVAGIKAVTLEVGGEYAYGSLRSERGTHRLVRLSPFNAANKRQTSFASVELLPLLPDESLTEVTPRCMPRDHAAISAPDTGGLRKGP